VVDLGTPAFKEWMSGALKSNVANVQTLVDIDSLLLCTKPSQKAMWYIKMKAFGNHTHSDSPPLL
jgi:hypothetical protein